MARSKKQKPEDTGPAGAPEWVVTFTDMISLLVTFFVLLMTFSSLEEYDLLKVESWLTGDTGILANRGMHAVDTLEEDFVAATDVRRGSLQPHDRPSEELEENLADMGQRQREGDVPVYFANVADGIVLEFADDESFSPGSTMVSASLRQSLGEIGRTLEAYPHMVVVEGFTDGAFLPTDRHPTAESLSFARASAAADIMLQESRLPVEQVQIVGRGAAEPRGDDATVEGRRRNRRVQIRVLSLSRLRASFADGDD